MVSDEKDRLGDKLRDAERGREDQYFAERDRKLLEQMRQTKTKQEDVEETIRPAVPMRCPKCGGRLQQARLHDVRVETCPSCSGVVGQERARRAGPPGRRRLDRALAAARVRQAAVNRQLGSRRSKSRRPQLFDRRP